jgi:metal-responsive CopG/Arc/MetJ family transcriptional regulator
MESVMRTTLDIDKHLLDAVEDATGEKGLSKAVNKALEEYLRRRKLDALRASLGTWDLDLDDWYEYRHSERT